MPTDDTATVDSERIHYLTAGDSEDPTALLLHGGIIDAAHVSWGSVIEPLARDCHVVAPDLLGYGESSLPPGPYPVGRHVDVIERFVETVGLDEPTVAGLSLGGAVGLGLALRRPELVEDLLLLNSYGLGRELPNGLLSYALARAQVFNRIAIALFRRSRRFTKASLGGIVADLDGLSEAAVDAVYEEVKRPTAGVAFRRFRDAEVTRKGYRTVFLDVLSDLQVPTRLLHGGEDGVVPLSWAERAADRIPESELVVLESCGHWPPREHPETVVENIRQVACR